MRSGLREMGGQRELDKTSIRDRPISGSKTQRHRVRTADTRPSSARVQEIVLSAIDLEPIRCCADPVFLGQQRKLLFDHLVGQRKKLDGHGNARGFCGLQIDRQLEFYHTGSSEG